MTTVIFSNVMLIFFLYAVENPSHCDFVKLRTMLIRTHMHDLKDITSDGHYENYRAQCIQTMTRCVVLASYDEGFFSTEILFYSVSSSSLHHGTKVQHLIRLKTYEMKMSGDESVFCSVMSESTCWGVSHGWIT